MSHIDNAQSRDIVAALAAAGCGIARNAAPRRPPVSRLDVPPYTPGRHPTLRHLAYATLVACEIDYQAFLTKGRSPRTVRARQIYYWLARRLTVGKSYEVISRMGSLADGWHHTTVLHGIRKVDESRPLFEPELSRLLAHFAGAELS